MSSDTDLRARGIKGIRKSFDAVSKVFWIQGGVPLVMVGVAQLVEHWTVVPMVGGSSPLTHPFPWEL